MYRRSIQIPRITTETLAGLAKVTPNIALVVDVPLITTEEQALAHATRKMYEELSVSVSEYIGNTEKVVFDETNDTWTFTFIIWGD